MPQYRRRTSRPLVTGHVLRQTARAMLPFYRKIACDAVFARCWSKAVVTADLDLIGRLFAKIPALAGNEDFGTNAIGYFISFPHRKPVGYYTNGTTIPPGIVQFTFSTKAHRFIARAVLPLYRKLAVDCRFANRLACAIIHKKSRLVERMVRKLVRTSALRSVTIDDYGITLLFKTPYSRYPYANLFFRDNY